MVDDMPADPFKDGQVDWDPLALGVSGLFGALIAHGLTEVIALELCKTYLHFMLGVMLTSAQQEPEPGETA